MGFYELAIVIMAVVLLSPLWTVFSHTINGVTDVFIAVNVTGAPSDYQEELVLGKDIMYFSWFFIILVLFAWVVKKSGQEQEYNPYG